MLIRTTEFLQFTGFADLAALEQCLVSEGHMSLPFRARADIILGSQRATTYGATTVANFEVLKVMPGLLLPWNTDGRPAVSYVFQGTEAAELKLEKRLCFQISCLKK